jgi:hypothetical protein
MAGARDIRIGLKVDGIDETRQDFKAIGDAVKGLGTENDVVAGEIVKGFGLIQAASARVAQGIERDGTVSQTALNKLIADYGRTREAIDKAFPGGAPDALNTALQTAETRIRATIAAADDLPAHLTKARAAFKTLEAGPSGVEAAARRMEQALDDFAAKLKKDGDVGKGDVEKIWKAQILLRQEIEDSGTAVDKLGTDFQQRLGQMEVAANKAATTVKKLETETDRLKTSQIGTNQSFTGFGSALSAANPELAKFIGGIGGIGGAFTAGLAAGQKLNQFIGTDMSEWTALTDGIGLKMKGTFEALFDFIVADWNLTLAKAKGDQAEIEKAYNDTIDAAGKVDAATSKTRQDYVNDAKEMQEAAAALKEIQDGVQYSVKGTSERVDDLVGSMQKLAPEGALNSQQMGVLASEMQGVVDKLDNLTPKERARLQTVIDTAKNVATLSAEQKQAFIDELASIDRLNEVRKDGQGITIKWTDAAKQATAETDKLKESQDTGATGMIKFSDSTDEAAGKSKKLAQVLEGMQTSSGTTAKSTEDLGKSVKVLSDHAPAGATALDKVDESIKKLSTSTPTVATSLAAVAKEGVTRIADDGPKAATSLEEFRKTLGKFDPKTVAALTTALENLPPSPAKFDAAAASANALADALERINRATAAATGSAAGPSLKPAEHRFAGNATDPANPTTTRRSPL